MVRRLALVLAVSSSAPLLLLPRDARAQDVAAAEALFNKGVADMDGGRFDAACPELAESQRLDPRSGTLFTLATCNAKSGKIATAVAVYEDYLRSVSDLPAATKMKHADRVKIARGEVDKLRPQVPVLKLVLPASTAATTARVRRDGTDLSAASLGIALPVDPGEHVVTLEVPERAPAEHRFSIARGEAKTVELHLGPLRQAATVAVVPPPVRPPPDGSSDSSGGRRTAGIVVGGVGAALLVVGGVTGGLALAKKKTVDADCAGLSCSAAGESAVTSGRTLGTLSTVGFVVGGAALATGAVLFFTAPAAPRGEGARVGPVAGAGLLLGPSSASFSFEGAF
jgi:hypothetical protein